MKIDLHQKQTLIFQKLSNTDVTAHTKQPIFPIPSFIVVKIMLSIVSSVCYLSRVSFVLAEVAHYYPVLQENLEESLWKDVKYLSPTSPI